ncbi:DUF1772 domain-containing protein [Desertimonas flava]|uniref:anthrone oxygenase family protein n=1 Tax=Desertimonas flava TaxID=2064846 RepID=UPI000E352FB8|nr:anthrone oxygenase family protein [Desertimonas flava]
MIEGFDRWATVTAIAATGLMAGFFFAYSTITMSGLRAAPGAVGLRAMQDINRAADRSPLLMLGLFGTMVVAIILGVRALGRLDETAAVLQLVAGILYIVGAIVLTMVYHVPRNNALLRLDPDAPASIDAWRHYASTWTAWNHVRTVLPLVSTVLYTLSLRTT